MQTNIGYTSAEIAAKNWSVGDIAYDKTTQLLEVWSGSSWVYLFDSSKFEIPITSLSDLPTPIGGIIQLLDNKTYRFQGLVNIGTNQIHVGASNTLMGFDKSDDGIIYTGTTTAITFLNKSGTINNMSLIVSNVAGQGVYVENTDAYSFQIRECIMAGAGQAGTVNGSALAVVNNNIITCGYGWDFMGNINKLGIDTNYFLNPSVTKYIHLEAGNYINIKITNNDFTIDAPNPAILVDNTVVIVSEGGGSIVGNAFSGTGTFISGIDDTTNDWIIEDNGRDIINTSDRKFIRKVRNKSQLLAYLTLPDVSDYVYEIDGTIDMGSDSIVVPSTGVTFRGYGNNFSVLTTSSANATLFTGGGNLFVNDLRLSCSGTNSKIFNLTDPTGFNACEFVNVNFENIVEIGSLSNYRQGLILNGGFYSVSQGFTFNGTWSGGFRVDVANSSPLSASGFVLFKAGTLFAVGNRFVSNANLTINTPAIGYQFTEANFSADAGFQLIDGIFRGTGTYIDGITASSRKSLWRDTIGIDDTFQGIVINNTADTTTDIVTTGVWVELAVTKSVLESAWFTANAGNTFSTNYDSSLPINIGIEVFLSLSGVANNEIELEVRNYETALGGSFTSLGTFKMTTNGGTLGTRVEPVSLKTFDRVLQGDDIRVFVRNTSGTGDISLEAGSKLIISKR